MYLFTASSWFNLPAPRRPINAASNTAGPGLLRKVRGLRACYRQLSESLQDYGNPRAPRLIQSISAAVRAPAETVLPTGSTLRDIERFCTIFDVSAVVCLQGDFPGYARGSAFQGLHGIPLCIVDAEPGAAGTPAEDLARAAARYDRPIVYVTAGTTNPMQTTVDARAVVDAVRKTNRDAIILVDTAYVEFCGLTQAELTPLALENDRVIILAPASKILFHAGIAAGWIIIGDAVLRAKAQSLAFPYPMPGVGAHLLPILLMAKREIAMARAEVAKARDILVNGLNALYRPERIIAGPGPWALLDAGDQAQQLVEYLAAHAILVQRQSGVGSALASNWVRISATVCDEVLTIIQALRRFERG